MTGTVENVRQEVMKPWNTSDGKEFKVDSVRVDGTDYIYYRLSTLNPLSPGQNIEFEPGKNKQGKDKMSRVKIVAAATKPSAPARSAAPSVVQASAGVTKQEVRIAALAEANRYYATYKKPSTTAEDVLQVAEMFEAFISGNAKTKANDVQTTQEEGGNGGGDSDNLPF